MALRSRPDSRPSTGPEKIRRTMVMNTTLPSWSSPRNRWPTMPTTTEKVRIRNVQPTPMRLAFRSSFWLLTAMKRMMMWGMPK